MQLQLMCCALSNLSSSQFMEGWIKRDKGKSLRGQGAKRLKSIFELANTLSNYRLYTKYCGGVRSPEFWSSEYIKISAKAMYVQGGIIAVK